MKRAFHPAWLLLLAASWANAQGYITTIAGGGISSTTLPNNIPLSASPLGTIGGIAFDSAGNMYGTDRHYEEVFKVSPNGILTVIGGYGGHATVSAGDGGSALTAIFNLAGPIAVDSVGNVYVVDINRVRKIDTSGIVTAFAGNGAFAGFSGDGGPAPAAEFSLGVGGIAIDSSNNVFIADTFNNRIREVTADGNINTVYGNGSYNAVNGAAASSTGIPLPWAMAFDSQGNLFFSEYNQFQLYEISSGGILSLVSNNVQSPNSLAVDTSGDIYANDPGNYSVNVFTGGVLGTVSGVYASALAADASGNVYFAVNGSIQKKSSSGTITTIGGTGFATLYGDGGLAVNSLLGAPQALTIDSAGNLLIADTANKRIAKVDANGIITTVAGSPSSPDPLRNPGSFGQATSVVIGQPNGVVTDSSNFYFDDGVGIRKVNNGTLSTTFGHSNGLSGIALDPHGVLYFSTTISVNDLFSDGSNGIFAGNCTSCFQTGDGGPAYSATIQHAVAVTSDSLGQIYIADGARIRKVNLSGIISTVAGNGTDGFSGDGGPATQAQLGSPSGVAVDGAGNIYIADTQNLRIRKVNTSGIITTIAGNGTAGFSGDLGPATSASLSYPQGVYADNSGNVYIADTGNNRIRMVSPSFEVGALSLSGAMGAPGRTASVGVQLSLTSSAPTAQVSNILLTLNVAPAAPAPALTTTLAFQQAGSLPAPTVSAASATSITLTWSNLATPLQDGANLGTLIATIPSSAVTGQVYNVQTSNSAGSFGATHVPLSAAQATIMVTADYLVGDSMPASNSGNTNNAPNFGDNALNSLDLIQLFRAVTGIPGFAPPICTDRFDAMDAFPADTSSLRGGDGVLDNLDLLTVLNRVNGLDTSAPRRFARDLYCPASDAQAQARQRATLPTALIPTASLELSEPTTPVSREHTRRVGVYLVTDGAADLETLSLAATMDGDTPLSFVADSNMPAPTLADADLAGVVAEAWLTGVTVPPSGRLLLGYLEYPADATHAPRLLGASANLRAGRRRMEMTLPKGAPR